MKNTNPHHECVDENKRAMLKITSTLFATAIFAGTATNILAEEQTRKFEYIPSKLGIDYYALAPSPLAEMLSQGEVEWMKNAQADYGDATEVVWAKETLPFVASGRISEFMIEDLRAFTPNMLAKFAVGLNPQDVKYGGLWSVGNLFVAERFAGKS